MPEKRKHVYVQFPEGSFFDTLKLYKATLRRGSADKEVYLLDSEDSKIIPDFNEEDIGIQTRSPRRGQRPVGEELIHTLPPSKGSNAPSWQESNLILLGANHAEYRGCKTDYESPLDFFGGVDHHVKLQVHKKTRKNPTEIETWPTSRGAYMSAGLGEFYKMHPSLRPGDKIHFERTARDVYKVWVEKKKGRPKTAH